MGRLPGGNFCADSALRENNKQPPCMFARLVHVRLPSLTIVRDLQTAVCEEMPGTPMEQDSNVLRKLQSERSQDEPKCESVVREITQTDRLNKKLLVSVLERMKKSDGQFDKFMEDGKGSCESQDDSDF